MSAAETIVTGPPAAEVAPRGHRVGIRGATKSYGALEALKGVDLDIQAGSFTVLLGPSGSGKTTLLRAIAGIERLDAGRITLGPRIVNDGGVHVPSERRGLAMVFQDYALWPHMTVRQNVGYSLKRRRAQRDASALIAETLDRVGLGSKAASYPHELSGGQQQRVALARAIVGSPALVLFDEPLSNLDADLREHLRLEISTLTRESGATALYITHDQGEAFALADEVAVLRDGRIEQHGTPESIYRRPANPFVARFTGIAGSFPGTVVAVGAGMATVRVGAVELRSATGPDTTAGADVEVLVRPTATRLEPRSSPSESRIAGRQTLPGRIIDVAYRGRGYDHVVECERGTLTSVFDERAWTRGEECLVSIDPEACLAFPTETVTTRN